MMSNMNRTMQDAMRLMQAGDLRAATEAIQRGLGGAAEPAQRDSDRNASDTNAAHIEGQYRVIPENGSAAEARRSTEPEPELERNNARGISEPAPDLGTNESSDAEFRDLRFVGSAGAIHYKLFVPAGLGASPPLLVMLHGCTQSPDDFARGTRMNALAREHGYVVAYPAQAKSKNASKCWNWFRSHDQQRGQGEPAIIAELTRHLAKAYRLDDRRVYVAGLSAGGAMAAVLASTYPDVYAAIGVHSGLPIGAAHDLPSAFAAMRQGASARAGSVPSMSIDRVPAIVFHGDRDTVVHPCNGAAVVAQCIDGTVSAPPAERDAALVTEVRGSVPGGHAYTRTMFKRADGTIAAEQWVVHGGAHAWFGGDPAGSYTDPAGPDASEEMLRFFSMCARPAIN